MLFTKTRIAPTPSGFIHLGNVMSFLITAALARQNGAKILLRIDDIDKERVKKKYVEDIFQTLTFLGIPWDEGPRNYQEYKSKFSQIHRMGLYQKALDYLKNNNDLFACDCSRRKISRSSTDGSYPGTCKKKQVSFENQDACWRLNTVTDKEVKFKDISGREVNATIPPLLNNFVVRRKDKLPAYQMTSVVDDIQDNIDLIVRGNDLRGSTIAQVYLAEKLPKSHAKNMLFYHHSLMTDSKNRKMSKSDGATSIQHLRKTGKRQADIYRMIGEFMQLDLPVNNFEEFQKVYL
ncbi:MAG: glutamate--tRNA ligase family protein [Anditalea sp.]